MNQEKLLTEYKLLFDESKPITPARYAMILAFMLLMDPETRIIASAWHQEQIDLYCDRERLS